jgi:polysaccharide deacetylase family protein (PEP-CTERM system associated)
MQLPAIGERRLSVTSRQNENARPASAVANALTIDVEEWFHVSLFRRFISTSEWGSLRSTVDTNIGVILRLLQSARVRGTFYVLGWVAERHPELVRAIKGQGHEVGSHGYSHTIIYEQSKAEFTVDVERSIRILSELTGDRIVDYRAPSYSITRESLWALDILLNLGIKYDSSIFPVKHDRYGIPCAPRFPFEIALGDGTLIEFPLSTLRFFGNNVPIAGGAYLRLYPLWFIRRSIAKLNRMGIPVILYFHPWELDTDQPRQRVPLGTYVRHYGNIETMEHKLRILLREFCFKPVSEVVSQCHLPSFVPA